MAQVAVTNEEVNIYSNEFNERNLTVPKNTTQKNSLSNYFLYPYNYYKSFSNVSLLQKLLIDPIPRFYEVHNSNRQHGDVHIGYSKTDVDQNNIIGQFFYALIIVLVLLIITDSEWFVNSITTSLGENYVSIIRGAGITLVTLVGIMLIRMSLLKIEKDG